MHGVQWCAATRVRLKARASALPSSAATSSHHQQPAASSQQQCACQAGQLHRRLCVRAVNIQIGRMCSSVASASCVAVNTSTHVKIMCTRSMFIFITTRTMRTSSSCRAHVVLNAASCSPHDKPSNSSMQYDVIALPWCCRQPAGSEHWRPQQLRECALVGRASVSSSRGRMHIPCPQSRAGAAN